MGMDDRFIQELIAGDDPLAVIWGQMMGIYAAGELTTDGVDDLRACMDHRESALNELEWGLYWGFFEVYDLLLERAGKQDASYVLSLFDTCPLVIVADSLSVREAILLERLWGQDGWSVEQQGFAVAPFPPMTESLSARLLNTSGPAGGVDRPGFSYRYVAGPEQVPTMPSSGPVLVWMRLPDTDLEKVTMAGGHTVAEAYQAMVRTLEAILLASGRTQALITSDHGYLYARSATHYWPMAPGVEAVARSTFSRASRVQPLDSAAGLRDQEAPAADKRLFAFGKGHAAIRGRYWWGTASANDRCTAHGGLSFVECLVPVLFIERR